MVIPPEDNQPQTGGSESGIPAFLSEPCPVLPVSIVLGMPQHNCQYHGICRIDMEDEPEACGCPQRVKAQMSLLGDRLRIRFNLINMSEIIREKHFATGYFVILTDFTLPLPVQKFFQSNFTIRQGVYPVLEKATFLEVVFH